MLIDIHTHHYPSGDAQVVNFAPFEFADDYHGYYSCGIHPWRAADYQWSEVEKFLNTLESGKFFALGEVGLDRACDIAWDVQLQILKLQLEWARDHDISLIIFHCVRAYSDIISLVKQTSYKKALLFHDFNGSAQDMEQLLRYPSFFSFGARLFKAESRAVAALKALPLQRIFLETDDQCDHSIQDIYLRAAQILGVKLEELTSGISFENLRLESH